MRSEAGTQNNFRFLIHIRRKNKYFMKFIEKFNPKISQAVWEEDWINLQYYIVQIQT